MNIDYCSAVFYLSRSALCISSNHFHNHQIIYLATMILLSMHRSQNVAFACHTTGSHALFSFKHIFVTDPPLDGCLICTISLFPGFLLKLVLRIL